MKAAISRKYGPPSSIVFEEIPTPTPKENEVLIAIKASTVNRTDSGFLTGLPKFARLLIGFPNPKYHILGCEYAGEIVALGSSITKFKLGDKVFGFGDAPFGGHATFRVAREDEAIAKIPSNLNFQQAAALAEGAHYALCDIRAANIKANMEVMVYGAGGAIGSAAVQLLKAMDVKITAVCGTHQVAKIAAYGLNQIIDYQQEDFTACKQQFDLVFDAVGKSSFAVCKPLLKPNGIYISTELGPNNQNPFLALWHAIKREKGKRVLFPIPTYSQEDINYLGNLAAQGKFMPLIDRTYPFAQLKDAYEYVLTGQKTGNVIIEMPF
jgi:NADPH:quinone reductase-like Zn-dependent oxidoreductase